MTHACEVHARDPQPTLAVRTRAPVERLPQVLGPAFGAVMQHAGRLGAAPSGPPYVAYYNMDMQALDLEIGFPFAAALKGEGEVLACEIPGGKLAECLHVGPYDQIGAAYDALQKWIEAKGYTPTGTSYEFYLNDPSTTAPADLQTRVVFPLK